MGRYAVCAVVNGFDENNPALPDPLSRACIRDAVERFKELRKLGHEAVFVVQKSMCCHKDGNRVYELTVSSALSSGVNIGDIHFTEETVNALEDALAMCHFAKLNRNIEIEIFATGRALACYFDASYRAVARIIDGHEYCFRVRWPKGNRLKLRTAFLYYFLWMFTKALTTEWTDGLFRHWYNYRHDRDQKRRSGFRNTI